MTKVKRWEPIRNFLSTYRLLIDSVTYCISKVFWKLVNILVNLVLDIESHIAWAIPKGAALAISNFIRKEIFHRNLWKISTIFFKGLRNFEFFKISAGLLLHNLGIFNDYSNIYSEAIFQGFLFKDTSRWLPLNILFFVSQGILN